MNSNPIKSLMPRDLSKRTTMPRFVRWISGTVFSSSSLANAHLVNSRNALPGPTRPARPARWFADAREHYGKVRSVRGRPVVDISLLTGTTVSEDIPVRGLYVFCLTNPGSITKTTPSIVMEVSAMLVARTTYGFHRYSVLKARIDGHCTPSSLLRALARRSSLAYH